MKQLSFSLDNFVKHFNLINDEGLICFDALVQYKINNNIKEFESEVQVISIEKKQIDLVYLLSKTIYEQELPDMFFTYKETIVYIEDRCLLIFGNNGTIGDFEIFIYSKDHKLCGINANLKA